jgi:HSP20 family protein
MVPWTERLPRSFGRLERDFGRFLEGFLGDEDRWLTTMNGGFAPMTNVAETPEGFEVTVELPGMKPEDFTVEIKNGALWISGVKKEEKEEKGKTFHRVERSYGEFRRVIPLGATVAEERVVAEYKAGVLRVAVPKTETAKPKRVEVKV